MRPIDLRHAEELLDYAGATSGIESSFARSQLEGAVAAYNMLARNRVAYLADEVGLGKTYVALGVMAMLRHHRPDARILVIAPRENIQRKWIKERANFVRNNWRVRDGRVKSLEDDPARDAVFCGALRDWIHELTLDDHRDFVLRMTSFSLALKETESRRKVRRDVQDRLPWVGHYDVPVKTYASFVEGLARTLNGWLPPVDLLVVDEAHNLKHGVPAGATGAVRNRLMAGLFGSPSLEWSDDHPLRRIAARVLLLSATPFEEDYGAIQRQFEVFGHGRARLIHPAASSALSLDQLRRQDAGLDTQREVVRRVMLRRIAHLDISGERWTKNMYRRQWREGGYAEHDEPIHIDDPRQRLVVGLMQKKVSEVLQDERFGNHFQIGMLSSFESFLESVARRRERRAREAERETATFEGQQDARGYERLGIDTDALTDVVLSHRERFGRGLPHPKLDETARALRDVFETGEKALVFVRRVATVRELGDKLVAGADEWIRGRMDALLPDLAHEVDELFRQYDDERRAEGVIDPSASADASASTLDEDEGGIDSFFAWFFRGKGPEGMLSAAAFQKNRLSGIGSVYSTMFEDDWVGWLLGRPADVLGALADSIGMDRSACETTLRDEAWARFRGRTRRKEGYPRLHVFEAYQATALAMLARSDSPLADRAEILRHDRFPAVEPRPEPVPAGFPGPRAFLGLCTVFTELERRHGLRQRLWPEEQEGDFRASFRRRETRRELLSAMARLGAAYVDLYLLAIRQVGSFRFGGQDASEDRVTRLVEAWLDHLESQIGAAGFTGFHELDAAASSFDTILAVNFHEAPSRELWELAALFGATLQRQVPVGAMAGQVNQRLVRQFRMPGFPLVLVTTDVLQEGEDLHTFCRRVIHYGISWTPSAMEQRTGRVDRVGSLVQRDLDRSETLPEAARKIQVHFPHLRDTVEVLQVKRVLSRMNRFMRLIHEDGERAEPRESRMNVNREITREWVAEDDRLEGPLESAFPVDPRWLEDSGVDVPIHRLDEDALRRHLQHLWSRLCSVLHVDGVRTGRAWSRAGVLWFDAHGHAVPADASTQGCRRQKFALDVHTGRVGGRLYLRCVSGIGEVDLSVSGVLDDVYELQRSMGMVKLAARPVGKRRTWYLSIERSILFDPGTTQYEELDRLVRRVVGAADRMEEQLLDVDAVEDEGEGGNG